ncbi:GNAT family N-acetyltransferase [Roseovarius sp. CH_XMU1461]|jgi:putative acetyltransferase|uniref:GNAT family N-acetyltransferase n=1 Tax=Roseovarius sp. CH_XMU1461 TaxID=3107777 RepID=UPI00300BBC3D
MIGQEFSREMRRGDEPAVEALLRAAFGGGAEAQLVAQLRKSGRMAGEVVQPQGEAIIGYYALSQMRGPKGWLCLAPVAVDPDHQGRGVGRRMIGMLAEWARLSGQYVVVLGQPEFYGRAGFSLERAAKLHSPYPVTQTLLAGPGTDVPQETLVYPPEFESL